MTVLCVRRAGGRNASARSTGLAVGIFFFFPLSFRSQPVELSLSLSLYCWKGEWGEMEEDRGKVMEPSRSAAVVLRRVRGAGWWGGGEDVRWEMGTDREQVLRLASKRSLKKALTIACWRPNVEYPPGAPL